MAESTANAPEKPLTPGATKQDQLLQTILSAAFAALLVATPLMRSDTFSLAMDGQIAAPAMLWLMLAICATAAGLLKLTRSHQIGLAITRCDLVVGAFFVCLIVASFIACANGNRRAGWNMTASWVSLGLTYLIARLLVKNSMQVRAIVAGILLVAVLFSLEGLHEAWVVIPNNQARFRQDPAAVLSEAGVSLEGGALAFERFRSRLLTQGPSATFALENSFAGFLIPAAILMVGLFLSSKSSKDEKGRTFKKLALAASLATLGYCVFLTHSTAAIVSIGVCLLIGAVDLLFRDQTKTAKFMRWGAVAVVAIIFAWPLLAPFAGEAFANHLPQTLKYRAEYWQSSAAMLTHFPLWGCGPGNFQDAYAKFMLPQAGETIADPHNLFWEVLSTSGAVAGLLFIALVGMHCASPLRRFLSPTEESPSHVSATETTTSLRALSLGAAAGIPLALLLSLSSGSNFLLFFLRSWLLIGILPGALLAYFLYPWVRRGTFSTALIWLAWLGIAIHLTVSGGISNPGTGTLFFLLLAMTQFTPHQTTAGAPSQSHWGVIAGIATLVTLIGLGFLHYQYGYVPVLASQAALNRADIAGSANNASEVKKSLEAAATADPWSAVPATRLAMLEFQNLVSADASERRDPANLLSAVKEAITKGHTSPALHYEMAFTLLQANAIAPHEDLQQEAIALLDKTTQLAPTKSIAWAYLAYASNQAGDFEKAKTSAKEALRLDALNPHADQDLEREPSPVPGRRFPDWLRELAELNPPSGPLQRIGAFAALSSWARRLGGVAQFYQFR